MQVTGQTLYKTKVHVDLRDIDFQRKAKLSSLFGYFQDVASLAANELGYGIDILAKQFGISWVLAKIRVDIQRHPTLDEELTIETWPIAPGRIEFERDFIVRDKNGEIIIRAVSIWVLMDLKERRIKRGDTIGLKYPELINERAIHTKLKKLNHIGELEHVYKKVIGYSDIDINGHLNNSKYIDYIMDCFSITEHENYQIQSIEVHFKNEALPGQTICLLKDVSRIKQNFVYVEGANEQYHNTVFQAQIKIMGNRP